MVIRDSTHAMTSQTFTKYFPGFAMPVADCASGKVHLAFCDQIERDLIAQAWRSSDDEDAHQGLGLLADAGLIERIRE